MIRVVVAVIKISELGWINLQLSEILVSDCVISSQRVRSLALSIEVPDVIVGSTMKIEIRFPVSTSVILCK